MVLLLGIRHLYYTFSQLKSCPTLQPFLCSPQLIVEKASAGDFDHVRHALDLLVDVIAIFVRILVILMKRAEDENRKEERRKKRN